MIIRAREADGKRTIVYHKGRPMSSEKVSKEVARYRSAPVVNADSKYLGECQFHC